MSTVPKVNPKTAARRVAYAAVAAAALLAVPIMASAQQPNSPPTFSLETTITIPGAALNSFDISWVDPQLNEYFLSDRSHKAITVIDTGTSPPTLGTPYTPSGAYAFEGVGPANCAVSHACAGPNGNLTLFNRNGAGEEIWAGDAATPQSATTTGATCATNTPYPEPFTSDTTPGPSQLVPLNGSCTTVKVFSVGGGSTPTHVIPTNGIFRADELCHDPADHLVLIANDADLWVNFIDTNTYKVVSQLNLGPGTPFNATNGIEQCQWNPRDGMIYMNIPEVNGNGNDSVPGWVVIIDPRKMAVVHHFVIPIDKCAGPQGMALGPDHQILLGCNAKGPPEVSSSSGLTGSGPQNTVVIDDRDGHVIKTLDNQGGNDEVWFNPENGLYFLAEGSNAANEQLGVANSQPVFLTQDIVVASPPGAGTAHSVAAGGNEVFYPIPGNVCATTGTCLSPCPAATVTDGCVAVFQSSGPPRRFVFRGHGHDHQ
jgi:hypothetical protein